MTSQPYAKFSNQGQGHSQQQSPGRNEADCHQGEPQVAVTLPLPSARNTTHVVVPFPWGWTNLGMSVASIFFCSILGVIATVLALLAYVDYRVHRYQQARTKRTVALALSLVGTVIGGAGLTVSLYFFAYYTSEAVESSKYENF